MLTQLSEIPQTTWLILEFSLFLVFLAAKRPHLKMEDVVDEDLSERTHCDFPRPRASNVLRAISEGMARVSRGNPSDKTLAMHPKLSQKAHKHNHPGMKPCTWLTIWRGITDPDQEPLDPTPMNSSNGHTNPMLRRPDSCPFCSKTPDTDYLPHKTDGGTIYYCPSCNCIVYVRYDNPTHQDLGRTYQSLPGQPFVPPVRPLTCAFSENSDFPEGLFDGIVDPHTSR